MTLLLDSSAAPPSAALSEASPLGPGPACGTSRWEARRMLIDALRASGAGSLAVALAEHVLRLHADDPWPVVRAAGEALTRRAELTRQEKLRVQSRPSTGAALGRYATARPGRGGRLAYETRLLSMRPIRLSCDCEDFRRNGLGICTHGLAVLHELESKPRRLARARAENDDLEVRLDWDPVRPMVGVDAPWHRLRFRADGRRPKFAANWVPVGSGWLRPRTSSRGATLLDAVSRYARQNPDRVSPAARAMLEEARGQREAPDVRAVNGSLGSMKLALYPYQREGVHAVCARGRLLLADDMGLGKTAQAIGVAHVLSGLGRVRKGLIVVPAALQGQWLREWRAFTDRPIQLVSGRPGARRRLYRQTTDGFLVISYAKLRRDRDALASWGPELIILDEAQRMKNAATQTAKAVKHLTPEYRLALTGTPMENRLAELASLVEWVDPCALEPKWRLEPVHGGPGRARNLSTIRARIAHCFLRRRRAEVLGQLPLRTDSSVPVPLTQAQSRPHDAAARKVARLASTAKQRPLSPAERLELLKHLTTQRVASNGVAQLRFDEHWPQVQDRTWDEVTHASLGAPKLEALREVVAQLVVEQGRTIVVFSQWRRMLQLAWWATRDQLDREGLRSVFFTGAESPRARDRSVVELHDDPRTRVLFATDAGGVGLNLQRAANACVHLELPWNPAVLEQRVARIHRLGQEDPIDVVQLVTQGSIEERIGGLVAAKRSLFDGLFDSDADEVSLDDRNLLERLDADDRDQGWEAEPSSVNLVGQNEHVQDEDSGSEDSGSEGSGSEDSGSEGSGSVGSGSEDSGSEDDEQALAAGTRDASSGNGAGANAAVMGHDAAAGPCGGASCVQAGAARRAPQHQQPPPMTDTRAIEDPSNPMTGAVTPEPGACGGNTSACEPRSGDGHAGTLLRTPGFASRAASRPAPRQDTGRRTLLESLEVGVGESGRLTLSAGPEAAAELAALLRGIAALVASSA